MGFAEAFNAFAESATAVVLIMVASVVWAMSPLAAVVILLASVDAFDDVYYAVNGKSIYPPAVWKVLNYVFESVSIAVATVLFMFTVVYVTAFPVPFWYGVGAVAVFMMYSSFRDLVHAPKKIKELGGGGWV